MVGLAALLGFCACSVVGSAAAAGLVSAWGAASFGTSGCGGTEEGAGLAGFSMAGTTVCCAAFAAAESGRAIVEDKMAGSIGAPWTVAWALGARLAGGVYRFAWPLERGENSLRTPLYLHVC